MFKLILRTVLFIAFSFGAIIFLVQCKSDEGGDQKTIASENSHAGADIVKFNCNVCHAQGINGAPIKGNKKMWGKRVSKGRDQLVQNAINGYGLMPAKGGKAHLSDEEVALAVDYFLELLN